MEALVKIRRPVTADTLSKLDVSKSAVASTSGIVAQSESYYREAKSQFWGQKTNKSAATAGSSSSSGDGITRAPVTGESIAHYVTGAEAKT